MLGRLPNQTSFIENANAESNGAVSDIAPVLFGVLHAHQTYPTPALATAREIPSVPRQQWRTCRRRCRITFRRRNFSKISSVRIQSALEPSRSNPQFR